MSNRIPSPDGTWKARRRAGLPQMTSRQMDVLLVLRAAKQEGFLFIPIEADKRTIRTLIGRDWILSMDLADSAYQITLRGLKALEIYERSARRFDKMCLYCGQPRGLTRSGKLKPYCDDCTKKVDNSDYRLKGHQFRSDTPCSRCKKRPRHQHSTGRLTIYCSKCLTITRRREKKRKMKRLLAMIHRGEPVLCHCGKPRYHTKNTVYDYCREHYREQQNRYMREHPRAPRKGKSSNAPSSNAPSKGVR